MISLLDNPVWEALGSKQSHFKIDNTRLKNFTADIAPLLALSFGIAMTLRD